MATQNHKKKYEEFISHILCNHKTLLRFPNHLFVNNASFVPSMSGIKGKRVSSQGINWKCVGSVCKYNSTFHLNSHSSSCENVLNSTLHTKGLTFANACFSLKFCTVSQVYVVVFSVDF